MIQITGLTKAYRRGRPPAVLDLTFDARPGMVTALLGDEGAGKSTVLRLMVGLERGHGLTLFDGRTYRRIRHPEREIGVLLPSGRPEAGHPGQRARSHLRMLAGAIGVPARRADDLLEQTRLAAVAGHRIGTFSPGMHRRLALAAALLGNPSTLLLDAPTEGLSPNGEEWFGAFLRSFALSGGTVLTTTRSPEQAAALADRVVTLDAGRLAADQPVVEFRRTRLHPEVLVRGPQMARLADLLVAQGGQVRRDGGAGLAVSGIDRTEVGELAYRNGILLHELADRVVRRPVSYPSALPSGSGRSGQVSVRTVRQDAAPEGKGRQDAGEQPWPDRAGQPVAAGSDEHRPAAVGRPAGPESERPLDHRGLQAGRWAAAALAPNPPARGKGAGAAEGKGGGEGRGPESAQVPVQDHAVSVPAPTAPVQASPAPGVDLTRRTPRGASALGRSARTPGTERTPGTARETERVVVGPVAGPAAIDTEHLAANPTDAELLTPARIGGVDPHPADPVRPFPGRPWSADATELRPAGRGEPTGRGEPVERAERTERAERVEPAGRPQESGEVRPGGTGAVDPRGAVRRSAVGDENGSE
ncbi:ABC-2 type transport system ATP-binding protein [Kitasatospora sp. SolWspMP-SS2h]|uniref:ATP-binding cassette domain-containing protein n=1 Tax=Kitasatospora sp. SolWspMP-SS2h TaxID=1305729 RepID=UPI000DB9BC85|nr:ATP-binding cassette domain-containing protein [Kitasatospora sp. SolWspMP-SS2h]RAJ35980.1 ABC-2 type transport system ATP-binding protein [Kitasatospora sp. SolWspMP-SS2h]